jgi:hypothetical protein
VHHDFYLVVTSTTEAFQGKAPKRLTLRKSDYGFPIRRYRPYHRDKVLRVDGESDHTAILVSSGQYLLSYNE